MERPDLIFLDLPEVPGRPRQVPLWAIMAAVAAVALALALARGWELGCGLVAGWALVLLALTESIARRAGWSRVRAAAIVAIGYPWLALAAAGGLLAFRGSSDLGPLAAEAVAILVRVVLVGVPAALVANYYLVLAEAYPVDAPAGTKLAPPPESRDLVLASLASWGSGLAALVVGLVLTV